MGNGPKYPGITYSMSSTDRNVMNMFGKAAGEVRKVHGDAAAQEMWDALYASESYEDAINALHRFVTVVD